MIERLQKFAKVLSRIRYILLLLAGACAVLTLLSLIDNPWLSDDRWLPLQFHGFSVGAYAVHSKPGICALPPPVESAENWRQRLSYRLHRGMMWLMAMLFMILSVSLILLSYQLLRVSFM